MKRFFYDLHIHSCLSPCGDDDMTVNNIAGMACVKELQIIALTDHNSCANCGAFFKACENYGIVPIPGIEVTTAEEIHILCYFETLEKAMEFDEALDAYRMKIINKKEIFGNQYILDAEDNVIDSYPYLLTVATSLGIEEAVSLARSYGAACLPAHIDRPSNSLIAVLGSFPEEPDFNFTELWKRDNADKFDIGKRHILVNSDAHLLENINEPENTVPLDVDDDADAEAVRSALIKYLRGTT